MASYQRSLVTTLARHQQIRDRQAADQHLSTPSEVGNRTPQHRLSSIGLAIPDQRDIPDRNRTQFCKYRASNCED